MISQLSDQVSATQAVRDAVNQLQGLGGGGGQSTPSGGGSRSRSREDRGQFLGRGSVPGSDADIFRAVAASGDVERIRAASESRARQIASNRGIPGFAKGGVVTDQTLAMVGEGDKPEAVVPLQSGHIPVRINSSNQELKQEIAKLNQIQAQQSQELARVRERLDEANEKLAAMEEQGQETGTNLERAISGQGPAGGRGAA